MFGLIDIASIAAIVGSLAFVIFQIKVELKTKI